MQTQRLILWVIFGLSLVFLWDAWQRHNGQPTLFGSTAVTKPQTTGSGTGTPASSAAPAAVPDASVPPSPASGALPAVGSPPAETAAATAVDTVRLRNDLLVLDIDLAGAQVRRAELLRYRDTVSKDKTNVALLDVKPAGSVYLAQSGLIGAAEGSAAFPNHRTVMSVQPGGLPLELSGAADAVGVTLLAQSGGVRLERRLRLAKGSYVLEVSDVITNVGEQKVSPVLYLQLTRDGSPPPGESEFYSTYTGPVIYTERDKFQKVAFSDIDKGKASHATQAGDGWLAIIQHYFLAAWLPSDKAAREYYTRKVDAKLYSVGAKVAVGELSPGASATLGSRLLVGPQDQRMLESLAPGLDLAVDYGWLTAVAKPIFWLLEVLHGLVGNWGWAIVLLTIVIKTLFYPLQAASYRSMARMKAVTPRLMALRERYGDDRVRLNQAMMELYKQEKINPLGGCLPIVVQIPVFIALYWVLLASVEMRDAPWIGWIHDLSMPDPFYVLPVIMAVTMFIQTKLNPTPPDPVQAKVMMFMPLVFSVMFFFFPAGLVLYWLVNNVYSIAQQWVITRRFDQSRAAKAG